MGGPSEKELRELVHKCWMTHDGMSFAAVVRHFGVQAANRVNKSAIAGLAPVETARLRQAFNLGEIRSMADVARFMDAAADSLVADFMDLSYSFPTPDTLRVEMGRCFALEGMRRLGVDKEYECGIYWRLDKWMEALGLSFEKSPEIKLCRRLTHGECHRQYRFDLPA